MSAGAPSRGRTRRPKAAQAAAWALALFQAIARGAIPSLWDTWSPRRAGSSAGGAARGRRARGGDEASAPNARRAIAPLALVLSVLALLVLALPAGAVEPDEVLADPVLEARARAISAQVRCVVCASEAIDSSQASIARDLRLLIRERLVAGDADAEVYGYLTARYGDYVLLRPPFKPSTYALWLAPFALLIGAATAIGLSMRRPSRAAPEPLTPDEVAEIERVVGREGP